MTFKVRSIHSVPQKQNVRRCSVSEHKKKKKRLRTFWCQASSRRWNGPRLQSPFRRFNGLFRMPFEWCFWCWFFNIWWFEKPFFFSVSIVQFLDEKKVSSFKPPPRTRTGSWAEIIWWFIDFTALTGIVSPGSPWRLSLKSQAEFGTEMFWKTAQSWSGETIRRWISQKDLSEATWENPICWPLLKLLPRGRIEAQEKSKM